MPRADESQDATPTESDPDAVVARSGRCAIVGRPNVGKSTLLNALLRQKLAIATPRPGTTRSAILGVYTQDDPPTQIAFVDTPGLHRPKSALGKVLLEQAELGLANADVVVFMTEIPSKPARSGEVDNVRDDDKRVLELIASTKAPKILAVNKVDLLKDKSRMLPLLQSYQDVMSFDAVVPLSARKRLNFEALVGEIRKHLPVGAMYDEDFFTDRPERFFVAELIREAVITQTRQEVPHGAAAVIDDYVVDGDLVRIKATIVVEKASHKGIVIGARGARIKTIGTHARQEIEKMLDQKVFLELWVKVIPGWTGDPNEARRLATEVEQS
ncbi:MAG: GTPase Era [Polyangiales bacterium]